MRITSLSLEHFRSYERLNVPFSACDHQLFIGENASGKTNLIEALSFLSMGRSCLRAQGDDIVHWGRDFFRIRAGTIADDSVAATVEYVWQCLPRRQSAMFVSDVRTPLLRFIGVLPTIVFLPQDLDLFTGPPSQRRGFLDALLSQLKPDFAAHRLEYERILKQRNAVLARIAEGQADEGELQLWDEQIVQVAARLTRHRDEIITLFNRVLPARMTALGEGEWTDVRMVHDRKTSGTDAPGIEAELKQLLAQARARDLVLQTTTVGPHRDDWHLEAMGRNIALFASRGQQRAALVGLLLTSAALFQEVRGERPVILLDDVLSELDDRHQSSLLTSLSGHQVLMTTTERVPLLHEITEWTVESGTVRRMSFTSCAR